MTFFLPVKNNLDAFQRRQAFRDHFVNFGEDPRDEPRLVDRFDDDRKTL